MTPYSFVFFDLDGTLTDPGEGITNSVAHALRKRGFPVPSRASLNRYVGPPLLDAFQDYAGMTETQAERAISDYREYFRDRGIFENVVYDGIPALLARLCEAGVKPVLATSKPELFARRILDHFGLARYFFLTAGATMDNSRSKKADVIAYALAQCPGAGPANTVMVGDREHDVRGAGAHGLPTIGVLYGYGSREELEAAGAAAIAATVSGLAALLLP